jgi:hypothetical protein
MQNIIAQLTIWQKKDQISSQIEVISVSTDWYRGGRKIGNLRREYKPIEKIDPIDEALFSQRITAAHQTYMDRLAVHKLKGPSNQQGLKDAEISRNKLLTHLLNASITRTKTVIEESQQQLSTYNSQEKKQPEYATLVKLLEEMEIENSKKNNRINYNNALLDALESTKGFVGCSAEIKIIDDIKPGLPTHA